MKLKISIIYFLFIITKGNAQFQVNGNSSASQLVNNVLFGQSCGTTSNHSFSSNQNVGYFNRNNTTFPIDEGIIIRSGVIAHSTGNYSPDITRVSSQINSNSDTYLLNLSNASGQTSTITDTAFLEFDFVSQANRFSFDFLFASNEYGQFQCGFSDVFAFVLTDLVTNVSANLAVVPSTTTPVSVKTIRNNLYNFPGQICTSSYPEFFGSYNVNNPSGSPINFRGQTILMNASSTIIPNRNYRIKIVIGDYNDSSFDSAIFISNGEFISNTDLGPDFSICTGNTRTINSGLSSSQHTFKWNRNGVLINGETNSSLVVSQSGTYYFEASQITGNCKLVDTVVVSDLTYTNPTNVVSCNTQTTQNIFNLNINNAQSMGLNPAIYEIRYFDNNVLIPTNQYANYNGTPNQNLTIRIFNLQNNEYCGANIPIQLQIINSTNATQPSNIILCQGTNSFDLTSINSQVLNGSSSSNYTITFHDSQLDAQNGTNAIPNPNNFQITASNTTIWIRMQLISNSLCFNITSFQINLVNTPLVDTLPNLTTCSPYVLPALTNGNYFTGTNGSGTALFAGNTISTSQTIYIFNQIPNTSCNNQSSFIITVQLPTTFQSPITVCSNSGYTVPSVNFGAIYSALNGTGSIIPAGTVINSTQNIYYYYELNGIICTNQTITINVLQNPTVSTVPNYTSCLPFTLPNITNGNFFSGPNGTGTPLFAGNVISSTQTVYIFTGSLPCPGQSQFQVTILKPEDLNSITGCGQVIVPAYPDANFYTLPNGQGNLIPAGTILTTNQTIYLYFPNIQIECITYVGTNIIINPLPTVDQLPNVFTCDTVGYTLPTLTNGNYVGNNAQGIPLVAGMTINVNTTITIQNQNLTTGCVNTSTFDIIIINTNIPPIQGCLQVNIPAVTNGNFYEFPNGVGLIPTGTLLTQSQTVYFYSNIITTSPNCTNNIPVQVNVLPIPLVDDPADVITCSSYTLPPLVNGLYYSLDGASVIPVGTVVSQTTTFLIYNYNGFCGSPINTYIVNIINPTIALLSPACNVTIPTLPIGNYYSAPNGQGNLIPAGTVISSSQTIYYFVATNAGVNCTANYPINITVYPLPTITNPNPSNVIACENYTLLTLTAGNYFQDAAGTIPITGPITSSQTVYIVVTNQFGCSNSTSFQVQITQRPAVASFNGEPFCYIYPLPVLPPGLGNYYTEPGGQGLQLLAGYEVTSTQTIYIYNPNPTLTSCYGETNFTLVKEGIEVPVQTPVFSCDSYTLPTLTIGSYYTATYTDPTRVQLFPGQQISSTQTIFIYAENINTRGGICRDEEPLTITITTSPVLPIFSAQYGCGSYTLPSLTLGNYYSAPNGQGNIIPAGTAITSTQTIHVYIQDINNPSCKDSDSFLVTIYPLRILNIPNTVICYNYTTNQVINAPIINSGVNPNEFTVNWYLNNQLVFTGPNFIPTTHGTYTVSTVKVNPEGPNDCNYAPTQFEVERSSPIIASITYNEAFTENTFIEVIVQGGYGTYEYQLNNGSYQSSNRFENLASGYYTVTVKDLKGCSSVTFGAYIINYPKFFTPNGDGYNDTWNITNLLDFKESKIYIFDRYGKFLKEIFPYKKGWDGRYNNQEMPSSDYWFVVYYTRDNIPREFKAHFSLKR